MKKKNKKKTATQRILETLYKEIDKEPDFKHNKQEIKALLRFQFYDEL